MGDGPPKKHTKQAPVTNPRARMQNFFAPQHTPNNETSAQKTHTSHTAWATRNALHLLSPRVDTHTIIASADLAIALPTAQAATLRTQLTTNPLTKLNMECVLQALEGMDIQLAMRRDNTQYTSTPMNGYCTACVLDAVCRNTSPEPFATPGLRHHLTMSLSTILQEATTHRSPLIAEAMTTYLHALTTTATNSLPMSHWMDESLTMAAGRLVSPAFQTWTEHSQGIFPDMWMQLNTNIDKSELQAPTSGSPANYPSLFDKDTPHCGYARAHHFLVQYDNGDLLRQLKWLLIGSISVPILGRPLTPTPRTTESLVAPRRDPISYRRGSTSLHINARNYARLQKHTALTPSRDMAALVRHLLSTTDQAGYIGCSLLPAEDEADKIPADGFCAYHTIWKMDHPTETRPPHKNRRYLSPTMDALCANAPMPDTVHETRTRLLKQANLPRALWPPLSKVAQWLTDSAPTCMWAASEQLPLPWLELAGLPSPHHNKCTLGAAWTLPQLQQLASISRHTALDGRHYHPIHPQLSNWEHLMESFCLHVSDCILIHRKERRGHVPDAPTALITAMTPASTETLPAPAIQTTNDSESNTSSRLQRPTLRPSTACISSPRHRTHIHPRRVHFNSRIDDRDTAATPLPHVHPAMCVYHPPPPVLPPCPARRLPNRQAKAKATQTRRSFPPDAELFVLASQVSKKQDLIVLAPSPFNGSRWAAFARARSQFGAIIGRYTAHRAGRPPCVHPSDPVASTGEYTMERPHQGETIRIDPWMFDTCHARFVEEAPTLEQVNVDWITRNGHIYLINVSTTEDIEEGDLYLTNYGEEYWCRICFPLHLLQKMHTKYYPTMTPNRRQVWTSLLTEVAHTVRQQRLVVTPPILRREITPDSITSRVYKHMQTTHHTTRGASTRAERGIIALTPSEECMQKNRQRRRCTAKKAHRTQVIAGTASARRSTPPPRSDPTAHLDGTTRDRADPSTQSATTITDETAEQACHQEWTHTTPLPHTATHTSSLKIMHWPCRGSLYCPGQYLSNEVRHTLQYITRIMKERHVDIMWISDAHITKGMLDPYIPHIYRLLPDCAVLQFPTSRIVTASPHKSNECMGGAVAIISAQWKGFITTTYTDPIGIGIINAVRFKIHDHCFSSACHYFPPSPPGTGPATIHSRVTRFQNSAQAPTWARRMTSHEYVRAIAQAQQTQDTLNACTRFTCGDYNADTVGTPAASHTLRTWLATCNLRDPSATTKHKLPGHHTRQANSETQANSTLDHHFHSPLPPDAGVTQTGTLNDPEIWRRSDHLMTWITLAFTTFIPTVPLRHDTTSSPRCDIDLQNKTEVELYQLTLDETIARLPRKYHRVSPTGCAETTPRRSGQCIAAILRLSVRAVEGPQGLDKAKKVHLHKSCRRLRSNMKDGYSPTQQLLHSYGEFYRCIIHKIFSTHKNAHTRHIWSPATAPSLLRTWASHWREKYHLLLSTTTLPAPAANLPNPMELSSKPFNAITLISLRALIKQTHTHLHGADRHRMRLLCNSEIQKREELRTQGKHGKLIELLTNGGDRLDLDLTTIPCPHEGQIVDPQKVHDHVSKFFTDWYAIPSTLDKAGHRLAHNMEWTRSLLEYHDTGEPQPLHPQSKIPVNMQDGIRRACAIKVNAQVQAQLREVTSELLTFGEFDHAINQIRTGSAPGPSDATANMIKAWTPSTRRLIFAHMTNLWLHKFTPRWMKDKVVKLAPKIPGSSALANMRPISLYEVVRKVWTTTIARRIHLVWHTNNVLNPAQHGYRLDQGTHMALIRVLDIIEGAHHTKTPTAITFWDIRRAFDSIPRTLQQLAWERLGVPQAIAEWFVKLDDGGLSFLATPQYQRTRSLKTPAELLRTHEHFSANPHLAIIPERGVGQGESASSLMWTAVYDILLDWIDPTNMHLHHYERIALQIPFTPQEAALAQAAAYADDLTTAAQGPKALVVQQQVTTWISAFGAFSALELHPGKIVSTTINSPSLHWKTDLTVRDHQWKAIRIKIDHHLASYKYLGIHLNLQGDYTSSLKLITENAQTRLHHLLLQPASPQAKILYIRTKIIPITLYAACCMDWPLAAYEKLDIPFIHAYRRILSLPERSPRAIYHLPPSLCGIGLPCIADLAQIRKWNVLQRCQAIGGASARSVTAIFTRIPPGLSPFDAHNDAAVMTPASQWPNRPTFMSRSLIEWLAANDLCCARRNHHSSTRRDGHSLSTLAKNTALWYDEELYLRDDFTPFPLTSITTDGSFKVTATTHADILLPYTALQNRAAGGGGIILTADNSLFDTVPMGLHIKMDIAEKGMNAYVWELLTQLIALHLIKEYPRTTPFRSDCCSAIARTNHALASHNNTLVSTKAGLLPSCMHQFACTYEPRVLKHIPAHPENDEARRTNPSPEDEAIFLADAVADGHNGHAEARLGNRVLRFSPHTLTLRHIYNELIPTNLWHIRHCTGTKSPVLGPLMAYQHTTRLANYKATRDATSGGDYWTQTSFALAHALHPPLGNTVWQLTRRATLIFDKLGHGANRAKLHGLTPAQQTITATCTFCHALDSQEHCMIACPHPAFTIIRTTAKNKQLTLAAAIKNQTKCPHIKAFAEAICHFSWSPDSLHIRRLWLGTWTPDLLATLIAPQSLSTIASMSDRSTYIDTAATLTAPLLAAYRCITKHITAWPLSRAPLPPETMAPLDPQEHLPLLDHLPTDKNYQNTTHALLQQHISHASISRQDHELTHIHPLHTTTDILPASPTDSLEPHCPYEYTHTAIQMNDISMPADARMYDS